MDIRLVDGDISLSDSGSPEMIRGLDEAVQRVRMAASVSRGSFRYDRELGADYGSLSADDPLFEKKLEMLIREACAGIADTEVTLESVDTAARAAELRVSRGGASTITEVDLHGFI